MTTLFSNYLEKNPSAFGLGNGFMSFEAMMRMVQGSSDPPTTTHEKSTSEAAKLRNLGNEKYGAANYEEALRYYSGSIAAAPVDSEELALAFGNRSAILFRLQKYELCLLDVNRALKTNFPERSKPKLLERKMECWRQLEKENEFKSLSVQVSFMSFYSFLVT